MKYLKYFSKFQNTKLPYSHLTLLILARIASLSYPQLKNIHGTTFLYHKARTTLSLQLQKSGYSWAGRRQHREKIALNREVHSFDYNKMMLNA